MRHTPIPAEHFTRNRRNLAAQLPPRSLVVLNANDVVASSADAAFPFRQSSDLFYLCGIDQEETILVLFPDAHEEKHREMLFLRETSDTIALWEGAKLTKDEARSATGIHHVHWTGAFPALLRTLMRQADHVFLNTNEHARAADQLDYRDLRFAIETQRRYPLHDYRRLAPLLEALRSIKSDTEIALITEACRITEAGFRRVLPLIAPGVPEYVIEAELIHEYTRNRAGGFAYEPIIASGRNSCVLHYVRNDDTCQDGDVLLMDVAASYAHYNADLTRTVPVNGRFTERQRDVYQSVHRVLQEATALLRPGILLKDYHQEVGKIMAAELVRLRLLDQSDIDNEDPEDPAYKKFFMHGTSHHLGLDVHDAGDTTQPVAQGMVFTVEPGIYIPDENLGIRLEDDIVIGPDHNSNLMDNTPIDPEEIEDLMHPS
ncbi:aminopeptidase P family protein [soil metagenome]